MMRPVDRPTPLRARVSVGPARALVPALSLALLLAGCGGTPERDLRLADVPGAIPRVEPKSKLGNMDSYVVFGRTYHPLSTSRGHVERGIASWYGPNFHGKRTSSGERYDMNQWTAAHKTLPLPTYAVVTNLENGRSLIVKINDRGPFVDDRIIDLSYASAKALGVDKKGTARVQVTSIDPRDHDGKLPKKLRIAGVVPAVGPVAGPPPERPSAPPQREEPRRATSPPMAVASNANARERASGEAVFSAPVTLEAAPQAARPAAAATDRPPPVQPAVASSGAGYYLQVGAFGARANAEELLRRLRGQLATPVSIAEPGAASGAGAPPLFRVRVGPVDSRADAERLAGQIAALGVGPSMVVPD